MYVVCQTGHSATVVWCHEYWWCSFRPLDMSTKEMSHINIFHLTLFYSKLTESLMDSIQFYNSVFTLLQTHTCWLFLKIITTFHTQGKFFFGKVPNDRIDVDMYEYADDSGAWPLSLWLLWSRQLTPGWGAQYSAFFARSNGVAASLLALHQP